MWKRKQKIQFFELMQSITCAHRFFFLLPFRKPNWMNVPRMVLSARWTQIDMLWNDAYLELFTHFEWQLQMVSIVFCWWIVCVALVETGIARRSLHHMRLAVHHVAHCFWISSRWSCVWSKNYLHKKIKLWLDFRVEMREARRQERIADKCTFKIAPISFNIAFIMPSRIVGPKQNVWKR